jgi:hypothetical protein
MSPERLARVLVPYRDNCKYLQRIAFEYLPTGADVTPDQSEASLTAIGDMSIAESCYIDSTGHFNAVEFQICANQLMYALGAECTRLGLVRALAALDLDGFYDRQLANVLITNVTSTFRRVVNPRRFRGRLQLERSYLMRERLFWECTVTYSDDDNGLADGNIVVTMGLGTKMAPKQ